LPRAQEIIKFECKQYQNLCGKFDKRNYSTLHFYQNLFATKMKIVAELHLTPHSPWYIWKIKNWIFAGRTEIRIAQKNPCLRLCIFISKKNQDEENAACNGSGNPCRDSSILQQPCATHPEIFNRM